jgi:hypothetical protein
MDEEIVTYKRVVINGEVIAGDDVEKVYLPTQGEIVWRILLKNGTLLQATGNITVVTGSVYKKEV